MDSKNVPAKILDGTSLEERSMLAIYVFVCILQLNLQGWVLKKKKRDIVVHTFISILNTKWIKWVCRWGENSK
jgi:hypothetical protein